MSNPKSPYKRVRRAFSQTALKRVCEMHENDFADAYGMDTYMIEKREAPDNFYLFQDNGSEILAVAHLDTVMEHKRRTANFVDTAAGAVVFSGALDDRLGAYTILELMPKLGIKFDLLLTVGEESGRSTAQFFESSKEYNWMIEFDRGGTDVVMYQYDDRDMRALVTESGARPADGIFSDISYMEHLEIKGFNWGVGYRDYHGPRSHAYLEDYWTMIGHFLKFHEANHDVYLPHEEVVREYWGSTSTPRYSASYGGSGYGGLWSGGDSSVDYKSPKGERWWDDDEAWTDEHWDAYLDGGIEAVRAMGMPDAVDPEVEIEITMDDDLVSEDFNDVNRALAAAVEAEE